MFRIEGASNCPDKYRSFHNCLTAKWKVKVKAKVKIPVVTEHTKKFPKDICCKKSEYISLQLPSSHQKPADFLRSISALAHSTVCKTLILISQPYSWGFALHNLVIACLMSRSYARFHNLILEAQRSDEFHAGRQIEGSWKGGFFFRLSLFSLHPLTPIPLR
jgi:hypothetical protein